MLRGWTYAERILTSFQSGKDIVWAQHRLGRDLGEVMFLTLADLDGDGRRDIVAAVRGGDFVGLRGDKTKTWKPFSIPFPPGCGGGKGVAIGDIDLDGRQDVVFSCENAGAGKSGVRWLSFDGSLESARWIDHEISGAAGVKFDLVQLIDLDQDHDLDVLTCEERENLGVIWYENPAR